MKPNRKATRVRAAREEIEDDVDADGEDDYVPPRATSRSRKRRGNRPWRKLLILLVILAGAVAALPTIVAKTPLRNTLLAYALPAGSLRVTVADASLGWLSAPSLSGVDVRDAAGEPLATVESIRMNRSPLVLVSNLNDLGEIEITRPVVHLAVRPDGTNWQTALQPLLDEAAKKAAAAGEKSNSAPPAVAVRVVDGTVLVEETATAQRWRLFALNAQFDSRGMADGLPTTSVAGQLDAGLGVNPAATPASFALNLTNEQGRQQLTWQLQGIPLAAAEPWLRLQVPGAAIRGGLFGQGTASWAPTAANPLSDCATTGSLTLQSVEFTAPELAGDQVRLANVELPWRLTSTPTGITIEDLQLKTDIGRFAARGTLDPSMFAVGAMTDPPAIRAVPLPVPRHDVEFQGEVELAPLAAMLPHVLRIRGDTTITAGKLQLAGRSQPIAGGESLSGSLRTSGLAATSAGRPLSWDQPVDATFELRREQGLTRLESLKCNSEFLSIDAAGTAEQLTANAKFDLNRLSAQLGQFVDLKQTELAGTGTAHVDWQQRAGSEFTIAANSELSQLRVALGDGKVYAEPRLALKAEASGMLAAATHEPRSVSSARVQIDAEGDQLDAQLTGPVDLSMADATWPFSLRVTGEISRWLARVRPWFAPDPWQASGQSEITAQVRVGATAIDVAQGKLSVVNLHVVGVGWNINEPRVEMAGDLHWNGVTGEVASESSQLVSSAVSLAAQDVRLQAGGTGPPRAGGKAAFRTDLARLAAWRSTPGQPAQYQPLGMVTGNVKFDQQADRLIAELNATGEQVALQQMTVARGVQPAAFQTIWQEPQVNVRGTTSYEPAADRLAFRQLQVQSTTLAVMADGQIDRLSTTADVNANGSLDYDLALVTPLLKPWVGEGIQLVGHETARFQAAGSLTPTQPGQHWARTLQARGELPWSSANVYGLPIGPGKLSAGLGDGQVRVDPLAIAVAEGQLTTAPVVRLDPEPMELTLPPGPLLTNVRISPQVSEAMLKYIAPVLAGATQSEGQFSMTLTSARVPLADSKKSDVSGQLAVHSVRVVPGPMAKQWVELAQQVESIAKRRSPIAAGGQAQPVTLFTVQDQQVNFRVVDGRVYHQGMQFQVGDVVMRTEGSVGFDQTVSLLVQVPIQDKWIEGQALLVGLKGQTLKIPISGTLTQPRMDQSAVAGLSQQLLQGAAQQAIGGELNKALDKFLKPR
jgi:translocation and assembly module TamB